MQKVKCKEMTDPARVCTCDLDIPANSAESCRISLAFYEIETLQASSKYVILSVKYLL